MKIDGKALAADIIQQLQNRVGELQKKNITPQLAILLAGEDTATLAYIRQKQKRVEEIGAKLIIFPYDTTVTTEMLLKKVHELNMDPLVHGIIVQRPLPSHIDKKPLETAVLPEKDIDGFHPESPFAVPVAMAVIKILEEITQKHEHALIAWLRSQTIVCLGKGDTAGRPIVDHLHKLNLQPHIIDSKTPHPKESMQQADILISCVGRTIIHPGSIKQGSILIGVGLHTGDDGKLHGDYTEAEIETKAKNFTPTPGGVGPVNVAMLMANLVTATENLTI